MVDKTLLELRSRLLAGMVEFMELDADQPESRHDCGYSQADVDKCGEIVDSYLRTISEISNADQVEILGLVQHTVEQLNALNDSCDGCLIETDQREDLCELILAAAEDAGLESREDVTEQWREW